MKQIILLFVSILLGSVSLTAQQVEWRSFEELPQLMRKESKPVMIFLYTDWCKYCALQKNNTFINQELAEKLNQDYYCIQLNGESKETITFLNRQYAYQATGANTGQHELAAMLGKINGLVSYPTTIILSENTQLQNRVSGFLNVAQMIDLIEK